MNRKELLKNKGYWIAKIQMDLYDQLNSYLKRHNLNRKQFAKKLGVTRGYVSQILNGNFNYSISKFVELSLAINKVPKIDFVELEDYIMEEDTTENISEVETGYIQINLTSPTHDDMIKTLNGTKRDEYEYNLN